MPPVTNVSIRMTLGDWWRLTTPVFTSVSYIFVIFVIMRKENGFLICHQWATNENEILHKGGKSNCTECYQQFKEQDNLTKHLDSFIKDDIGDGIDSCHVTLVDDDRKQLLNKSLCHLFDLTIWWNIAEKWAMRGKNHLMCYHQLQE